MLARLRAKPGAEQIDVTIGDFATTRVEGTFSLAYLVFNTINNLTTQEEQVACFANVATHLQPGGYFVIEVGVPALRRLPPGETFQPFHVSETHLGIDEYDLANQGRLTPFPGQRRNFREALDPVPLRLAVGTRSDGTARRNDAAGALERLETRAVYQRQQQARLGLAEDESSHHRQA